MSPRSLPALSRLISERLSRSSFTAVSACLLSKAIHSGGSGFLLLALLAGRDLAASGVAETYHLASNPEVFWRGRTFHDDHFGQVALSGEAAVLARRLGSFPFWRGQRDFLEAMSDLSSKAAERGLAVLVKVRRTGVTG